MAPLFGLLAFLLNFIPSIGSIISTLLPIPIAVTQFSDPAHVVAAVVLPGIVHLTIGNIIEPRLMGRGLELHPVTVLLSLAFWGLLWGVMGMVLAVPIVAVLKIVLSRLDTTRPLGQLLAGKLPGTHRPPGALSVSFLADCGCQLSPNNLAVILGAVLIVFAKTLRCLVHDLALESQLSSATG